MEYRNFQNRLCCGWLCIQHYSLKKGLASEAHPKQYLCRQRFSYKMLRQPLITNFIKANVAQTGCHAQKMVSTRCVPDRCLPRLYRRYGSGNVLLYGACRSKSDNRLPCRHFAGDFKSNTAVSRNIYGLCYGHVSNIAWTSVRNNERSVLRWGKWHQTVNRIVR